MLPVVVLRRGYPQLHCHNNNSNNGEERLHLPHHQQRRRRRRQRELTTTSATVGCALRCSTRTATATPLWRGLKHRPRSSQATARSLRPPTKSTPARCPLRAGNSIIAHHEAFHSLSLLRFYALEYRHIHLFFAAASLVFIFYSPLSTIFSSSFCLSSSFSLSLLCRYVESPVVERLTRNTQGPPPKSRLQLAHGGNEAHSGSGNGSGPGEASDLLHTPAPTNHHASDNKRGGPPPSFMFGRTYHRPDPNQNASNSQNTSQGSGTQMLSSSNYGSAHQAHDSRAAANNNDGHVPPVARKFGPFAAQPPPQLQPPSNRGGSNHRELLNASDVSTSLLDAYPGSYPGTPPLPEGAYASNNDQRNDDSDVSRDASHEEESNDDEGNLEGQAPTAPTQEEVNQATNAAAAAAGAAVPFAPTRAFHEMMTRQAQHLARSAENARRLAQQATPSFQPNINAKSSHLVAESGRGSFEQRLAVDVLERHGSHSRASQERGPSSRSRSRSNSHHSAYGAWPANDVNNSAYGQPSFEQQQQAYYYNEQQSESGYGRGSGSSLLYDYPEPPSQVKDTIIAFEFNSVFCFIEVHVLISIYLACRLV